MVFLIFRGKSRSVDHGLSSPFDLDSLRSKVEGRFESVDKLNRGEFLKQFFLFHLSTGFILN
jgi:hypothetical protein